ncbi:MAG TPA: hypothetical protein VIK04_03095 [Solirubrobacteraceae bacterium]
MLPRGPRASRAEMVLLVALAVWGLFPIVVLLIHAAQLHAQFTGADGLIGADGVLGADQLQYLAWARDAGVHGGLASDLFTLAPSGHVYLEPLFAITGWLYRLGLSLPLAYLVFKPVAVIAMFAAAVAWARRLFADRLAPRAAAVVLCLFLYTPLTALFSWTRLGSGGPFRFQLYLLGNELLAADKLWGYVPSALGLALVPAALLATERALGPAPADLAAAPRATRRRRAEPRALMIAAGAALVASWLHPWQGVTLILIFAGLAVLGRLRCWATFAIPAIGAALPLAYYYLLSQHDPAWELASHHEVIPRLSALVLLAGFGPLAPLAALGVRRPRGVVIEQALLLWVLACFVTYFANDSFAPHALQGLSFPFAILAVRGWQRLRLPVALGAVLGTVAIGLVTIPGLAYDARKFVRTADSSVLQYYLPNSDADALNWVETHAPAGGVLAPTPFAVLVPAQTGRNVWVGHGYWSVSYEAQAKRADRLFGGRMTPASARAFVAGTGARILVSDCKHPRSLTRALGPLLGSVHSFGCARVYVLRRAG